MVIPFLLLVVFFVAFGVSDKTQFRAIFPLGAILLTPAYFLLTRHALGGTFVDNGCEPPFSGGIFWLVDVLPSLILAVLCVVLCVFLARGLVARRPLWLEPAVHWTSRCALIVTTCLLVAVAPRALRLPSPDQYVESLPLLAEIPRQQGQMPTRVITQFSAFSVWPFPDVSVYDVPVADFIVRRSCVGSPQSACWIDLTNFGDKSNPPYVGRTKKYHSSGYFSCDDVRDFAVKSTVIVVRADSAGKR